MAAPGIGTTPSLSRSLVVVPMGILYLLFICPSIIDAAPVTRSARLILNQEQHAVRSKINHQDMEQGKMMSLEAEVGMMTTSTSMVQRRAVELNDYPGSGANNRHTPRQQFGRCVDC
ncbi:unnamed protein product [Linum trigynum]|uniref:Uncharacterized protein n=1 Tax=Linum trigynum TaxID=586398 RepID=A0AAV2E6Y5_9ROSI